MENQMGEERTMEEADGQVQRARRRTSASMCKNVIGEDSEKEASARSDATRHGHM